MFFEHPITYQSINLAGMQVVVKRLDKVHPTISGNKFYKLKYNFLEAKKLNKHTIVSFGGAYSNHIFALAHACKQYGFNSVGVIRGEELADKPFNSTLTQAKQLGMQLHFISRKKYRTKHTAGFIEEIKQKYPDAYIVPEGGSNKLAVVGCEEILNEYDKTNFDVICCAVGTGGTIAGIINASNPSQTVLGFCALKGQDVIEQLTNDIKQWTQAKQAKNWKIQQDEIFAGYGKYDETLLSFIDDINQKYQLPLEPIYTGKALYALKQQLLNKRTLGKQLNNNNLRILFIHTGGLQAFRQ